MKNTLITKPVKNILIFVLIFLALSAIFSLYNQPLTQPKNIDIVTLINQIDQEQIKAITVKEEEISIELKNGDKEVAQKETGESLSSLLKNYNADMEKVKGISIANQSDLTLKWIIPILSLLLPIIIIFGFFWFIMRQAQGANNKALSFGQSGAREFNPDKKNKTTFKDVAGVKEAKQELMEVVEFLKNSKKFTDLGAVIPRGVLLLGAPGTGKTLLAKAVAGEANVPFYSISGSEFVEMFVGVGASRVRDLFKKAKKNAPCILFIDEIDAVGRQRGAGLGGSHDEREQTLNQILVEMDGFDPNTNVIVIAATNRPDVLDKALLRPGRFDRQVVLDKPDLKGREEILKIHGKDKPLASDVNYNIVARRTPGFTGADLENVLNEAAILAARADKKEINMEEVEEAIDRVIAGPEKKSRIISDDERDIVAHHEVGHAILSKVLPHADSVHKVSILPRGMALGYTLQLPEQDRHLMSKGEALDQITVMMGGRVAEEMIFNEITSGAQNDLQRATDLAKKMVCEFGMSKLGPRTFGRKDRQIFLGRDIAEMKDYSEETADQIDEQINSIIDFCHEQARKILLKNKAKLLDIAKLLKEKESLENSELEEALKDLKGPEDND